LWKGGHKKGRPRSLPGRTLRETVGQKSWTGRPNQGGKKGEEDRGAKGKIFLRLPVVRKSSWRIEEKKKKDPAGRESPATAKLPEEEKKKEKRKERRDKSVPRRWEKKNRSM